MFCNLALLLLSATLTKGSLDKAFDKIPFESWLTESNQTRFHWSAVVSHPRLSFHQRLESQIEVTVDGKDLQTRRNDGHLIFFMQITDSGGARYQDHTTIDLSKLDENIKAATVQAVQPVFLLPGDYRFAVAFLDTATGEHSVIQSKFHVAAPGSSSFLPAAWSDLPAAEFISNEQSPDSWYLPDIQGRLQWDSGLNAKTGLDVVLNVAVSAPLAGARRTPSGGLPALLPTLKVISESGSPGLHEDIELLDLARHKAVFETDLEGQTASLDWPALKASLGEANTASIDVHSLSDRHHDAQFFLSQVRRLLRSSEKPSALVILTTPVAFESGEDLEPISLESLPSCRVFYIRYHAAPERPNPFDQEMGRRARGMRMGEGPMGRNRPLAAAVIDQLEATLKPLNPKVFDVETPEEISKALAEITKALARSKMGSEVH